MIDFRKLVKEQIDLNKSSAIREANAAGLKRDAIRSVLRGRVPSVDRAAEICDALGLEFYIGPQRSESVSNAPVTQKAGMSKVQLDNLEGHTKGLVRLTVEAGGNPIPDDLQAALLGTNEVADRSLGYATELPELHAVVGAPPGIAEIPGARPIGTQEYEAAAGGGAVNLDEVSVRGQVWFRRDWLDQHGLDPTQCVVISVRGESMEPTLPPGAKILVARRRRRRRVGRICVIDTADGLIVKRLAKDATGGWLLVSDNESPDWPTLPWPDGAEIVGEVIWTAQTFT